MSGADSRLPENNALAEQKIKVGVVGIPDGWSSTALVEALEARTGFGLLVDMIEVALDLQSGDVRYRDHDLCKLDGLIIKKVGKQYSPDMLERLELLRYIESRGVRVFSSPARILGLINRLSCTITLRTAGIPIPPTAITEDIGKAVEVVGRFGSAVLKPLYSTKARGMLLVDSNDTQLRRKLESFRDEGNPVLYIQKKLDVGGRDFGAAFLGGDYLGTYARVSAEGSWNTTIHAGGHYERHDLAPEIIEIARRAQAAFGLDFTTVDIAETEDGPVVFEVSAFGGFRGARDGLGIDAAALYADHVTRRITNV